MVRFWMLIATGFRVGYLPVAPGTWGSLLALPLHFGLSQLPLPAYGVSILAIILLAIAAAGAAEKIVNSSDPSIVVVDEVAGMLVTMIGAPARPLAYLCGFLLFRFFDIAKPFPVRWADRHLHGGLGIVMDDLFAGLYALLCLQLLFHFLPA